MHFRTLIAILGLLIPVVYAKVQFLGVAIAGGDFGCQIDGTCPTGSVQLALGGNGVGQMQHFVKDDGMNILRLPTSWQFLSNNEPDGSLDDGNLAKYDQLMQACLATGAYCMIDIHNFARWNGQIIGQGGPTDEQFASFWSQVAGKYAGEEKVVFELMNEPHDLDVNLWAQTCQKAITAIRDAGATTQMILLPGTNFDSAATLVSSGSAEALMAVTNPDGSTDGLLLDIHKYLDEDNSGTHAACTTDNIEAFATVATFLRSKGRKGLVSETGASSDSSCFTAFCAQNTFINQNSDVFAGVIAWAAGSFDESYVLTLTPSNQNGAFVDNELLTQCVLSPWLDSKDSIPAPASTIALPTTLIVATSAGSSEPTSTGVPDGTDGGETSGAVEYVTADTTVLFDPSTIPASLWSTLAIATGTPTEGSGLATIAGGGGDDGSRTSPTSISISVHPSATASNNPQEGGAVPKSRGGILLWGGSALMVGFHLLS